MNEEERLLKIIRRLTICYIGSLIIWGITAFPVQYELNILCRVLSIDPEIGHEAYTGLKHWIAYVNRGITETAVSFPFPAYGTDWLAFSHLVIAVAFIGVYLQPVRNIWIIYFGMIACAGIIPLALICGNIRGIPFYWQMIDCSFGIFGIIPLLLMRKYTQKLEIFIGKTEYKY